MAQLRLSVRTCLWIGLLLLVSPSVLIAQATRGTIVGTVTDASGAKLQAVPVVLTTPTGVDRPGTTTVEGTYTFGGLLPGEYRLRVSDDRFAPWQQEKIAVTAGERKTIDIVLQPRVRAGQPGSIAGTVIGPDGQPLAGAVVILTGPGGEKRATSATTGAYSFPGLAAGSYRMTVAQPQALPYASGDVPIAAGESRLVDVRLQPLPPPPPPPTPPPGATTGAGTTTAPPPPAPPPAPRAPDPSAIPEPHQEAVKGLEPMPNRWNFQHPDYRRYNPPQKMPFIQGGGPLDPYNQNQFKGDYPLGNTHTFVNLNLQFNSTINPQQATSADPFEEGGVQTLTYNQNAVMGIEFFGGNTVFQPKIWSARVTTVTNLQANAVGSLSFGDFVRNDVVFAFEELFGEARLAVLGPEFDFISVRGGMQNLNIDFRGFLYIDNAFGVRLFGNNSANRRQYNAGYFSLRERKGQLHDITVRTGQDVFLGNVFLGGFGADTYILLVNFLHNRDPRPSFAFQEEEGILLEGKQSVTYVGVHGDGHWGGLAINHAFYQAFGTDADNLLGLVLERSDSLSVNARMAAVEISQDRDAMRLRGSFFFSSGDGGAAAGETAGGFAAVQDNPNFAGGQFQFWTQQQITIPGIGIVHNKFSLLPELRNKLTDRSNFLNPGLLLFGGGVDFRLSPSLKLVTNASMLRFADVSILNEIRLITLGDEPFTDANIGLDVSAGFKWRPFVNENLFVVGGFALLKPMGGFANALGRTSPFFSTFATFQIVY